MNIKNVTDTQLYQIIVNRTILKIKVGDVQVGGSYVVLWSPSGNTTVIPIAEETEDGEAVYIIAPEEQLRNSIVKCTTIVQDINPDSNNTSVVYTFDDEKHFSYKERVERHNDKVVYSIDFVLI